MMVEFETRLPSRARCVSAIKQRQYSMEKARCCGHTATAFSPAGAPDSQLPISQGTHLESRRSLRRDFAAARKVRVRVQRGQMYRLDAAPPQWNARSACQQPLNHLAGTIPRPFTYQALKRLTCWPLAAYGSLDNFISRSSSASGPLGPTWTDARDDNRRASGT
jgi:hypothetical protein